MKDKRILVIEDEIIHAKDLKNQLNELGYENISIARDAKEALPLINETEFDLAFVDVVLSGSQLNGITLAKKITELRGTPIIFLTGSSDEDTTERILEINSSAHLVKPVEINSLRVNIQRAFAKKNGSKPLVNTTSDCPFKIERDSIFIKTKDYHTRIDINNITYIQSNGGSYTKIFLEDNKSYTTSVSLKNIIPKIGNNNLIRVHHSFAINKTKVTDINSKVLILSNKSKNPIPIGKSYKKVIKLHFDTLASD